MKFTKAQIAEAIKILLICASTPSLTTIGAGNNLCASYDSFRLARLAFEKAHRYEPSETVYAEAAQLLVEGWLPCS